MYLYFITGALSLKLKDLKRHEGVGCPEQKLISLNCLPLYAFLSAITCKIESSFPSTTTMLNYLVQ